MIRIIRFQHKKDIEDFEAEQSQNQKHLQRIKLQKIKEELNVDRDRILMQLHDQNNREQNVSLEERRQRLLKYGKKIIEKQVPKQEIDFLKLMKTAERNIPLEKKYKVRCSSCGAIRVISGTEDRKGTCNKCGYNGYEFVCFL